MDYLDPHKKKAHRTRLYIGYGLMAIAIAISTVILVYVGSGYYVDRQTGDLIQNGQIFVNSDPDGASIFLNDKQQKAKTAGKLVVPSGNYSLAVKKDGYRDWTQQVQLEGGRVQKLDYARLIPSVLQPSIVQTYNAAPTDVSQSTDRRFVSLIFAQKPNAILFYDLTKPDQAAKEVVIDKAILTDPNKMGTFVVLEWSEDGKNVLVENRISGAAQDYLLINRDDGIATKNLNTSLNVRDVAISLRERSAGLYFVFNKSTKTLGTMTNGDNQLVPRLSGVLQYKAYNTNIIVYITDQGASPGKVQARLTDGDKTYLIRELPAGAAEYLIDVAKIGSTTAVAIGSTSEGKVTVIRNPIGYLKSNPNKTLPLATTIFLIDAPTEVSFSTDGSVVMARGGQKVASHYFEEDRTTRYDVPVPLDSNKLRWSDGKHLQVVSGGFSYIFDFDGANLQKLVETSAQFSTYFDNNYRSLYSFSTGAKPFNISRTLIKID